MSLSQYFFHLFYTSHTFSDYPSPSDIALTAILVASKTEETYKRIREILRAAFLVSNPEHDEGVAVEINEELRQAVARYEEQMLEAIGYRFHVRLCPFKILAGLWIELHGHPSVDENGVFLRAWNHLETLHLHPIILMYPGIYLALACIMHGRKYYRRSVRREVEFIERKGMEHEYIRHVTAHLTGDPLNVPSK